LPTLSPLAATVVLMLLAKVFAHLTREQQVVTNILENFDR
jgi:hypothetical protein